MGHKILLSCFFSLFCLVLIGQGVTQLDVALQHLDKNVEQLDLTKQDLEQVVVSSQFTNELSGATYIYLNQTHNGIKVKNAIISITINKDGKVVHTTNKFVSDLASMVNSTNLKIKAEQSVVNAANHLGVFQPESPIMISRSDQGVMKFVKTSYTNSDILVEPMYDIVDGKARLVYQATLDMKQNADYWEIRMDANSGDLVSKNNLTVYCKHEKGQYSSHHNCAAHNYAHTMAESKTAEEILSSVPSYRVYPFPAESPSHGTHDLVVEPAILTSSPFGWHDTDGVDGPEYTITRGNNVYTYTDKDDDDSPDADTPQPDGGAELVFDFPHLTDMNPIASPDAAQVNLFYVCNMIHDIAYSWGFDEAGGNFQENNYTGEGSGNDMVLAQAFDGFELATPSLNNANFSTPADGGSGRMQMFLWEASSGAVSVDEPSELAGFYEYGTADYGGNIPDQTEPAVSGRVVLVNDGNFQNPTTGCKEIENDLTDKIAMIDRGLCDFSFKSFNAQTKGAIGVIICNIVGVNGGDGETAMGMAGGQSANLVTIPTVSLKKSDCDAIKISMSNSVDVLVTMQVRDNSGPDFYDGAYDNGIISHEFGHGISNRVTGGPNNSGCLSNDEQMGEGWSDYFALTLSVRPGEDGSESRGIGTYAVGEATDGRGIRRFPYSTDMNINPQTYDDIKGTTAPHPLGEVWVSMLWDMHWKFVDLYGYDANWSNQESGNSKATQLVIDGMRNQGCNPGFIEGRDGILAADEILFDGIHNCMIWDIFARRGLGYFAEGGSTDDRNDGVENFESFPLCTETLKIKKTATGFVEPGDDINVKLVATNHVPQSLTGVIVTDELPEGTTFDASSSSHTGTVIGTAITFELGEMAYEDEVEITYALNTSEDNKSTRISFYDFEDGGENWTLLFDEGSSAWGISFDAFYSSETSYYIPEEAAENDHSLVSPAFIVSGDKPALKFWHRFDSENGVDGGFLQVTTDGGLTWQFQDPSKFIRNGYNAVIAYGTLAIPSLNGYSGSSRDVFIDSYLDLSDYSGQEIMVRFRYGSNETDITGSSLGGWFVDDVEFIDILTYKAEACVSEDSGMHGACTLPTETVINSGVLNSSDDIDPEYFGMVLAPNPAANYVTINATSKVGEIANLKITSVDGKVVYQSDMKVGPIQQVLTVNTSDFAGGMYIVKLQSGSNQLTQKLIVH